MILAKGKLQMGESRKLGWICPDTSPAYLSRACFDVHYVRYSDAAVGKPHSLFYLLFARDLFYSVCF